MISDSVCSKFDLLQKQPISDMLQRQRCSQSSMLLLPGCLISIFNFFLFFFGGGGCGRGISPSGDCKCRFTCRQLPTFSDMSTFQCNGQLNCSYTRVSLCKIGSPVVYFTQMVLQRGGSWNLSVSILCLATQNVLKLLGQLEIQGTYCY